MCVGIPTHVKCNALFNLVPILWYWLGTPEMKDIYGRLGICKIFVKYLCKYRMHHPVFGNTHTCLDFPTHVWFLPNTSTCLRYLGKTTHVCEKPHTWKFRKSVVIPTCVHTCLIFTKHMEVLEIIGNTHTSLFYMQLQEKVGRGSITGYINWNHGKIRFGLDFDDVK